MGSGVAKVGLAFGMNVIAWSQNLTAQAAKALGAQRVSKEELLQAADVVSIHMVLSRRTVGLMGAAEFALMKPSARRRLSAADYQCDRHDAGLRLTAET